VFIASFFIKVIIHGRKLDLIIQILQFMSH
jgi:hypothetical protein